MSLAATVGQLLARCWDEPPTQCSAPSAEELARVVPLLLANGAAPAAWHRLRHTQLYELRCLQPLHDAYRVSGARIAGITRAMKEVLFELNRLEIPCLVLKGWVAAQLYARPVVRPYGDIDLLVARKDLARAREAVQARLGERRLLVDLHDELPCLAPRDFTALWSAARVLDCEGVAVTTLGNDDTLAYYCMHLLKHGGARPLWLCDIAAHYERFGFDPSAPTLRVLPPEVRAWMACLLDAASRLVASRPPSHLQSAAPAWMVRALHREWTQARPTRFDHAHQYTLQPLTWWQVARDRWPNPLAMSAEQGYGPKRTLGLSQQTRAFVRSALRFMAVSR